MTTYAELVSSLPACPTLTAVAPHSAVAQPTMPSPFVPPELRLLGDAGPIGSPVLLVSAPGAVGKSTLAAALATERNAWVWDLSKLQLGSNSFVGTLAQVFGAAQLAAVLTDLAHGRMLVVLDAFDEAEVLSGWQRIETFVREVWSIVHDAPSTAVVLLARSETAALLHMLLLDLTSTTQSAPKHAALEVEYFNRDAAKQFLDLAIADAGVDAHRTHFAPFANALDTLFSAVAVGMAVPPDQIWGTEQGRSFLGYAPVLQAIARFLASSTDFNKVAGELSAAGVSAAGLGVINDLIERLLARESVKVVNPLRQRNAAHAAWDGWNSLYDRDQQIRCILRYRLRQQPISTAEANKVPSWLQQDFLEAVGAFLQNHPFLRGRQYAGPAFRDFTLGYALRDSQVQGLAESELSSGQFVPTVLLADFHVRASQHPVRARHFGFVYESAIASRAFSEASRTTLVPVVDKPGLHDMEIDRGTGDGASSGEKFVTQLLVESGSPVVIRSRLRDAFMEIHGTLALGVSQGEVELENVQLSAREIMVNAQTIVARCYDKTSGVEITGNAYSQPGPDLQVCKLGSGLFSARWPGSEIYPWSVANSDPSRNAVVDFDAAVFALGRIMSWFRRDRRKELARYWELVENVAVGGHPVRQAMLAFLMQNNMLYRQGNFYIVNSDEAAKHAISFASIKQRPIPAKLRSFLEAFVAEK